MESKSDAVDNRKHVAKETSSNWRYGLLQSLKDPKMVYMEDELTTTIRDLYPKARHHYLVCPKTRIPSLEALDKKHLSLLRHMHGLGEKIRDQNGGRGFLIGYHRVPSMFQLHMHVISDDFDSVHMKNKKHWNSFTTDYFLPSEKLIEDIEENGRFTKRPNSFKDSILKTNLKCHKCEYAPKNMPDLKKHLKVHLNK